MSKLFISYRRKSWPFTHRLAEKLRNHLDAEIFVDLTGIDEDDFEKSILRNLRESNALLLIVSEYTFSDRIHRDGDWVRREIREALVNDIPIVLVAIDGLFPPPGLPDDIKDVSRKQGIRFFPESFDSAVTNLSEFIIRIGAAPRRVESEIANTEYEASQSSASISIMGQWLDKSDGDTVFFMQNGNRVIGIYDFGRKQKVGFYRGNLKGNSLHYDWEWFQDDLRGSGRMILSETEHKLSGEWWYGTDRKSAEPISYIRVSDRMPDWLSKIDYKEFHNFLYP